jgi:hypothetical protein
VATVEFNAMCFGMAVTELLNASQLPPDPTRAWRAALETADRRAACAGVA